MRGLCTSLLALVIAASAAAAPAQAMPSQAAIRLDIPAMTLGPDGNVWFAGGSGNNIGRVTRTGQVTLFKIPFLANPRGIAAGGDGALYFSEHQGDKIGRITTAGTVSQITLSTKGFLTDYLTRGPNNTLWFVVGNNIGELTANKTFILHRLTEPVGELIIPANLTVTRYGNVWFNDFGPYAIKGVDHNVLIRLTPQGTVTAFPVTYGGAGIATGLTVGPDGNLWYILTALGVVGRATPAGQSSLIQTSKSTGEPGGIVSGPQGNLWLACTGTTSYTRTGVINYSPAVEAVTPSGSTRVFTLPPLASGTSALSAITVGADGNLWFPEAAYASGVPVGDAIDRMTPQGQVTRFPIPGLPPLVTTTKIPIKALLASVVQRGAMQSIQVTTTPNAQISLRVTYPVSGGITTAGVANAQGIWQYSWAVTATAPGSAKVQLTVQSGGRTRHFSKQFLIL